MTKEDIQVEKKVKAKSSGTSAARKKKRPRSDEERQSNNRPGNKKRKKRPQSKAGSKSTVKNKKGNNKNRKRKNKRSNKLVTLIFDVLFFVFIILMLGGAALFKISDEADKSFFGYRFYEVLTNSMKKTQDGQKGNFVAGDMVIVKVEDPNDIEIGDIITFVPNKKSMDTYLTHRVIEKESPKEEVTTDDSGNLKVAENYPTFVTQGDANNMADPPVSGDMVIGVVKVAIPKAGTIIHFVRENLIAVLVFIVCLFLLTIVIRQYFAPDVEEPPARRKTKKKKI